MRILVYGLNYAPELTGIGKYTGELSAWLAARGHQVRVVTAPPYYPGWRIHDGYRSTLYRLEPSRTQTPQREPAQPTVFRTPLWVPSHPTALTRLLHLFSFALGSLPVMLAQSLWQPDLVFTVEPTLFAAPIALLTAALASAPAWLHVQDFEIDAAFHLDLLRPHGPLHALATGLDRLLTRRFSRVSTISRKMLDRLHHRGLLSHRTLLLPNWADLDRIYPDPTQNLRHELGLEGKIVLLYSGNMGAKQGLESLVSLIAALAPDHPNAPHPNASHPDPTPDPVPTPALHSAANPTLAAAARAATTFAPRRPHSSAAAPAPIPHRSATADPTLYSSAHPHADVHLLLCGDGAFRPQLESFLGHHPNVTFLPLQPEHRLNALLNTADIHLLPQLRGAADLVMPSKLTGMLASGRPILATADPGTQVADVVRGCGLVVPPGDPSALIAAARRLIADPILRTRLGAAARAYALEHLGKEPILLRFEQDLLALVGQFASPFLAAPTHAMQNIDPTPIGDIEPAS